MNIQIKHRWSGRVLYEGEHLSLRDAVSAAWASRADLSGADLSGADLRGAVLSGAVLRGAVLRGAVLSRADLSRADLSDIRDDLYDVLSKSPAEVPALLTAVREGRINGTVYTGECACLVGTIAKARGCGYTEIPGLVPNGTRAAERWFLALMPGRTPENDQVAAITATWIEEWLAKNPQVPAKSEVVSHG